MPNVIVTATVTELKKLLERNQSQDLSLAAFDTTTAFNTAWEFLGFIAHVTGGTISQTWTITIDAAAGAAFDTIIHQSTPAAITDFQFLPDAPIILRPGDEIRVQVTNTGTPARTVNGIIKGRQV
jgi:hypothetical protein